MYNFNMAQEDPTWVVPWKQFQVIYHDMTFSYELKENRSAFNNVINYF